MAILFEVYALFLFKEAKLNVGYQETGNRGIVDFLEYDEKIIIDTKYKKIYDSEKQVYVIDDIRQVSGYARDIRLLKKLFGEEENKWGNIVPDCLIVYPDNDGDKKIKKENLKKTKIAQFNKFYKYGIKLPVNEYS